MVSRREKLRNLGKMGVVTLLLLSLLCNTLAADTLAAGKKQESAKEAVLENAAAAGNQPKVVSPGNGNQNTTNWRNVWRRVGEKEYYYNKNGKCTRIYDRKTGKCQKYSDGKMRAVKKDMCRLRDGKLYYFDGKGVRVTKKGWKKVSAKKYIQIKKSGYVTAKMEKTGEIWRFFEYNYKKNKWKKLKDTWRIVDNCQYYFNKKGNCIRTYQIKSQKCREYKNGKMRPVKKDMRKLRNGRLYYFSAKGVRVTEKGWKKSSGKLYIQVGKAKWVTAKMQNTKGGWNYYKYDYRKKKWVKQKKTWLSVEKKKYYFDGSGKCLRMYNTVSRKCYDFSRGKPKLVKNDVREVAGKEYYFGADGVRVSEAGMYMTCQGSLIYAAANGAVTKRIFGQILSCSMANGKVASCRVKDGVFMCYYSGNAEPRRRIDTSRPMVALTYDDGPSRYTPEILDVLRQYNSVATFFVVGQNVPGHADIVRSAYQMGCEIGNHTYSHQILTKVGVPQIQSQIGATNSAVQNVTGTAPVIMRPPGGGHNATVRSAVGMPLIMWSIDTLDWKTRNAASTQAAVLGKVSDGDIVLMHDLYSQTAAASRVIIPELLRRGYQLVTVSELSDCRGAMAGGGVYTAFR